MNVNEESNDVPKKFTNIDTEDFEINYLLEGTNKYHTWVKAGETVTLPKYLVNFACTHLARKMVKRQLMAKAKAEGKNLAKDDYPIRDENIEKELHIKMIAENLPKKEEPKEVQKSEVSEKPIEGSEEPKGDTSWKCPQCDFVAKNSFGLASHLRKHK